MKKQGGLLRKAEKVILILLLVVVGFFYWQNNAQAANADGVVINEIAWMGTVISTSDEWIELKNLTGEEINLEGWILIAQDGSPSITLSDSIASGGYFLLERSNDDSVPGVIADLIYVGALGNSGEVLELRDQENNLIFTINASDGWLAGDNSSKQTMERADDGNWQTSENAGGTPKAPNSEGQQPEPPELGEEEEEDEEDEEEEEEEVAEPQDLGVTTTYKLGDVVINEFVSDPADEEVEWVELYNTTNQDIDLTGWTIEEGSGAKTSLEGSLSGSGENKFFILEKPKGNLNNKGDIIILRDSITTLIDIVVYGKWDDGNLANNAPSASDPYSVARKFDGQNSFNNSEDFAITTTLTKGTSNIITKTEEEQELVDEVSAEEKALYDYSDDIIITEIFPNPFGRDSEDEFIELYNKGERDVNLLGWRLGDESKKRYKFKEDNTVIKLDQYLVIYRSESKIILNNGNDRVKLWQPLKDELYQVVKYEKAIEGWSYNLAIPTEGERKNKYVWSEIVTPGKINEIITVNHPPVVDFSYPEEISVGIPNIFDSSDTVDEDGDELEFSWDFGDGIKLNLSMPEHTYFKQGNYTIKLIVSDGENEVKKEKIVKVLGASTADSKIASPSTTRESNIIISEILPNPAGSDLEEEWVELKNIGEEKINLLNWKLDDNEGGSKPYRFDSDLWIEAGSFYTVDRVDSGLALNNSADAVRLFNNFGELIEEIKYEKAIEGESYARGQNNKFFWTTVLTPGEENIIAVASSRRVDVETQSSTSLKSSKKIKQIIKTTLEKIKELESGELVKVNGVVAVKPGILGLQYFYIVGSSGIQIYNYKKEFPSLRIGDYIEVSGELSVSSGEQRIKTKTAQDIKVIEHREAPNPEKLTSEELGDDYVGQLISITGEVVERKSSIIYLDDGTDEVKVYIRNTTGINPKSIKKGSIITVIGIVNQTRSGIRVMPRSNDDIIKKDIESQEGEVGQVLGEVSVSDEWAIAERDKKLELFKYLLTIAGAVIVVLGGLLIKEFRQDRQK